LKQSLRFQILSILVRGKNTVYSDVTDRCQHLSSREAAAQSTRVDHFLFLQHDQLQLQREINI